MPIGRTLQPQRLRYPDLARRDESLVTNVYSEAELLAQLGTNPSTRTALPRTTRIRLGADIYVSKTIILGCDHPVIIDGCNQFTLASTSDFDSTTPFIRVTAGNVTIQDLSMVNPGASIVQIENTCTTPVALKNLQITHASANPDAVVLSIEHGTGGSVNVTDCSIITSGESDAVVALAPGLKGRISGLTVTTTGAKSAVVRASGNQAYFQLNNLALTSDGYTSAVFGQPETDCSYLAVSDVVLSGFDDFANEAYTAGRKFTFCRFSNVVDQSNDCQLRSNFESCQFHSFWGFTLYDFTYGDTAYNTITNFIGSSSGVGNQFRGGSYNYISNCAQWDVSTIDHTTSTLSAGQAINDDFAFVSNDLVYTRKSLVSAPTSITLSGAAPVLNHGDVGLVLVTFGATASGDCTITAGRYAGQLLIIKVVSNAGTSTIKDTGSHILSAAFNPTANDTLSLIWDGTAWVEIARSVN